MSKMIQLHNVPDALHRRLKACAASEGMSLSDFLTREVRKVAERPTMEEMRRRWASQPVQHLKVSPTGVLREERNSR